MGIPFGKSIGSGVPSLDFFGRKGTGWARPIYGMKKMSVRGTRRW